MKHYHTKQRHYSITEAPATTASAVSSCVPVPTTEPKFILQAAGVSPVDGSYVRLVNDIDETDDMGHFVTDLTAAIKIFSIY